MPRPGRSGQPKARPSGASRRPPGASRRPPGTSRKPDTGPHGRLQCGQATTRPTGVPVGGGGAWPGNEPTRRTTRQHTRHHWCGGRRRDRRARAGFEIDHSERSSRVAISRAAGPDGARNTRGARQRLGLGHRAARLAQGQAAVAVDGGTHVDEARARQERRVGAGAKLADGVQAFGGEAPSELGHEVGH